MVILRAAWRAVQAYAPQLLTRRRVIVAAVIGLAAGTGAPALLGSTGGDIHPVRLIVAALGIAATIGGQLLMISTLRAVKVPEGGGPKWDRDDALVKRFGRASTSDPVPVEHRDELARWGAQMVWANVPYVLGGVPAVIGFLLLLVAAFAADSSAWWLGFIVLGPGALVAIPGLIAAGRGQLVYERAIARRSDPGATPIDSEE